MTRETELAEALRALTAAIEAADNIADPRIDAAYLRARLVLAEYDAAPAHEVEPVASPWTPPPVGEREDEFRCLGWVCDDWEVVIWVAYSKTWWTLEAHWATVTHFAPLPSAPVSEGKAE